MIIVITEHVHVQVYEESFYWLYFYHLKVQVEKLVKLVMLAALAVLEM